MARKGTEGEENALGARALLGAHVIALWLPNSVWSGSRASLEGPHQDPSKQPDPLQDYGDRKIGRVHKQLCVLNLQCDVSDVSSR